MFKRHFAEHQVFPLLCNPSITGESLLAQTMAATECKLCLAFYALLKYTVRCSKSLHSVQTSLCNLFLLILLSLPYNVLFASTIMSGCSTHLSNQCLYVLCPEMGCLCLLEAWKTLAFLIPWDFLHRKLSGSLSPLTHSRQATSSVHQTEGLWLCSSIHLGKS